MPRRLITTVFATFALIAAGLTLATPAEATWSRPGDLTKYRLCKASIDGGDQWRFVSKVRKRHGSPDARAGIKVYAGNDRVARWNSGWLDRGEVQISVVRAEKSPQLRVVIWEEAGDLDSPIGTAAQSTTIKPHKIRRC